VDQISVGDIGCESASNRDPARFRSIRFSEYPAFEEAVFEGPEPNFVVCRAGDLHGSSAILAVVDLSAHFRALAQGAVLKFAVILGEFHERSGSAAYPPEEWHPQQA